MIDFTGNIKNTRLHVSHSKEQILYLLYPFRVNGQQVQLIHLLTEWDSPISATINLFLLPPDCLQQHGILCVTACPPLQGVRIGRIKTKRPL